MQEETEKIDLSDTANTRLPLGYRKIQMEKIPLLQFENKLMIYNAKYKFNTIVAPGSGKPISKILKFK